MYEQREESGRPTLASLYLFTAFRSTVSSKMGFTSALVGGGMGVGIQMFANYATKIPISRSKSTSACIFDWRHIPSFRPTTSSFELTDVSSSSMPLLCIIEPWLHAFFFTAGCYVGHKYPKWEAAMAEDVNKLRVENGMPPLVGGNYWIKYQVPEDK